MEGWRKRRGDEKGTFSSRKYIKCISFNTKYLLFHPLLLPDFSNCERLAESGQRGKRRENKRKREENGRRGREERRKKRARRRRRRRRRYREQITFMTPR